MNRINIISPVNEYDDRTPRLIGWFDPDKAEAFQAQTRWDGNNNVDINTSRYGHQVLYRTAGGRWVLHEWSQWQGTPEAWDFITDDTAREWLIRNDEDEAAERYFGEIEEEAGPGRPEVGRPINVRLGDDVLARVDATASERGLTRAALLREIVSQAV